MADGDGVSSGLGVGEAFFFRRGETLGEAVGDSTSAADARFFFGDAFGDGVGDSSLVGERFFFGVGVGDVLLEVVAFFFLCGVGVGVEKILLSA